MNVLVIGIVFLLLMSFELFYFKIANAYDIVDRPNARSSHMGTVIRGGGIIFVISTLVWCCMAMFRGQLSAVFEYLPFLCGLFIVSIVSFIDDIRSLYDSVRLAAHFAAMGLMFYSLDLFHPELWWVLILSLIVCVGATNIINFMDGINGITAGYSLAVLAPLFILEITTPISFIPLSFLGCVMIGTLVFSFFNFRPKGKAKCFAGDVGSIGIAFILLFCIGKLVVRTSDVTWLVFLIVYGVDGMFTIFHRIMLHENLGIAHRKHAYQIMANELGIGHVKVSLLYAILQLAISLTFIYVCPNTSLHHWIFLLGSIVILGFAYIMFMKKFYYLHEEYLKSLK